MVCSEELVVKNNVQSAVVESVCSGMWWLVQCVIRVGEKEYEKCGE